MATILAGSARLVLTWRHSSVLTCLHPTLAVPVNAPMPGHGTLWDATADTHVWPGQ